MRTRVLVVEDRPSVGSLMAAVLEDAHEVTVATHGKAALALLESSPFEVVLTDVRMPGASGFEVLRAVRQRAPGAEVVMMTAYANVPDAVDAIKQGAYDYVAKPLDADEIALVVARAAERARQRREGVRDAEDDLDGRPDRAPPVTCLSNGFHHTVEEARARASREYLAELLALYDGNVTHAAQRAGMTRESLHRVLRKYGVRYERPERGDLAPARREQG